jgi:amidohydrolase
MTAFASERLRALIAEELPGAIACRRDLHMHPEIGYEERRTAEVIRSHLTASGVSFRGGLAGGTGTLAHLPGRDQRSSIALRADIDALPIDEEGTQTWRSTIPGRMHACGHDGHTSILLTTARVLARIAKESGLPRSVTLLFQPAEEGGAGGRRMCEDGCLDGTVIGPKVERIYGLHGWPALDVGTVGTRAGALFACSDRLEIVVRGEGAHAAFPHFSRDPIVAGAAIVTALQSILGRNVDPLEPAVVSVTTFHGGSAMNVIPPSVTLTGTARALSAATRDLVERRIGEISRAVAEAHGCTAQATYTRGYPVTANDANEAARFNRLATRVLGAERNQPLERPVMGGEDFSFYAERVPACFFALGLRRPGAAMPALHHPLFDFNDDAIALGVEMFCRLALDEEAA